jgi:hypothetical protein
VWTFATSTSSFTSVFTLTFGASGVVPLPPFF